MLKSLHVYLLLVTGCCLGSLERSSTWHGPEVNLTDVNSLLLPSPHLQMLRICFSFSQAVQAAQTRYCGSLSLSGVLPSAQEPSIEGLIDTFGGFFSVREKPVLSKLDTLSVLR